VSWPRTGTTVLDRYVLGAQIGLGGTSEVYHAIDTVQTRGAAVKLLAPAFAHDSRARAMARQEARIIQRIRHPTIPRYYGHGDVLLSEGVVVPCTVMEMLTGVMLVDRLARGPLPWPQATATVATIADALAVAHRRGVVHRDLTPQNLMITDRGVRIIDFGLSREIATGEGDPASDVYSLGVLLYQLLTARSPYPTVSDGEQLAAARMRHTAPAPVLLVAGLPRAVADTCRDCMARRPADRPDSAEVALVLWSILTPGEQ
jgi:serine/threonine protein kinase